jgi:hypothetical protein
MSETVTGHHFIKPGQAVDVQWNRITQEYDAEEILYIPGSPEQVALRTVSFSTASETSEFVKGLTQRG